MAVVDSLEVQISAQATKADKALENLSSRLNKINASLGRVDGDGLARMASGIKRLSDAMAGFSSNTKTTDFSRLSRNLATINKIDTSKISEIASKMSQLSKSLNGIQNINININKGGFENLSKSAKDAGNSIKTIVDASGKALVSVDSTTKKMEQSIKRVSNIRPKIEVIRTDGMATSLDYLKKELENITNLMKKADTRSNIDTFISNLEDGLGRLKRSFPEQTQLIEDYKNKVESLKNLSVKIPETNARNSFKSIPEAARYSAQEAQKSLNEALKSVHTEEAAKKTKTLREQLKQLQIPPIQEENLVKLENTLEKTKVKMLSLKAELKNGLTMGKFTESADDKRYVKMREDIAKTGMTINALQNKIKQVKGRIKIEGTEEAIQKTSSLGNKVEELRKKLDELKSRGLNFGDAEFDKAYSELQKAEQELNNYKNNLKRSGNESKSMSEKTADAFSKVRNALRLLKEDVKSLLGKLKSVGKAILSFSGNMIAKGFKAAGSAISSFTTKLKQNIPLINKTSQSTDTLIGKLGRLYVAYYSLRRIGRIFSGIVNSASDYIEEFNYFNVSISKIAKESQGDYKKYGYDSAQEYADSFKGRLTELTRKMSGFKIGENGELFTNANIKNLGLDVTEITNFESRIAQMTNSVGMIGEASIAASKGLTMLSGDLSSLANVPLGQVMNNLSSGLAGASMAVKKYGIDISVATLKEQAASLGIEKSVLKMSQAEKEYLRVITMINQSKVAWGDLANTINQPANQFRMLKNNLKQISLLIGNMFMPMIQKVMPYINAMAIAVKDLIQWISDLFGLKWKNTAQALPDTSEFDSSYDDLVSDAEDAADATDKAADAQKKYNKQLQSFDELNNLTTTKNKDKDKDDDKDDADVSGVLSDALIRAVEDYEKRWNKAFQSMHNSAADLAKTIEDLFKRAWDTGDGTEIGEALATTLNKGIAWVNEHTDKFSEGLDKIASILGTSLNGAIEKFDFPGLGEAVGNSIKAALGAEEKFFDTVDWTTLGSNLATSLNTAIETGVLQQSFSTMASKIKAAIETAFGAITTFKFKSFGTAIGEGINDFFAKMNEVNKKTGKNGWEELAISFSEGVKGALEAAIATVTTIHWEDIGQAIATLISNMDTDGIGWNLGKLANSLATAFYVLVSKRETWKLLGEKIAGGINGFLEGMNEIDPETKLNGWQALGKSISDTFLGFGDTIITALDTIEWEKVGQAIAGFITSIDWGGVIWKLGEVVASFAKALKRALKGAGVNSTLANLVVNVGIGRWIIKKLSKTALGAAIITKLGKKFAVALFNVGARIKSWIANGINKTGLKAKIVEKVGKIATVFKDVGAVIKGWLPTLGEGGKVKDLITGIKAALGIAEGGVFSLGAIKTALSLNLPKIPTFVFPDPATDDLVRQFDQWLYHALGDKDFVEFTVDVFIKIGEFIGDIASQIGNFFGGTWEDTTALTSGIDVGNDLANGILQGFANALVYPVNFLYNLIVKPVKEALGIHSPSTVFKEIAGYCVSGFLDGFNLREKIERLLEDLGLPNVFEIALNVKGNLDEKAKNIKDWFAEKGKRAKDFIINAKGKTEDTFNKVKNAWNSFKEGTKNVAVKAKGKIEDTFGKVKDAWSNFKENTKSLWVKAKGKIEQAFEDVSNAWNNFKDGVKTVWAKAKGEAENTFDTIAEKWENFKSGTKELWIKAKGEAEDSFKKVFDAWTGVKQDAKDKIVELAVSLSAKKEDIENSLGTIKDKLKDKVVNLGVDLKTKVDDLWNNFRKDYPKLWEKIVTFGAEIKEKASDIWSNFKKENPELWDKIISFKGAISTKASEIWTFVSEKWKDFTKDKNLNIKLVFDFAVSAMKKAINTIISWINSYIINNLNKISIKIPEIKIAGKTLFGGKTFGFNIANIKTLAKGSSGLPTDELGVVNDQAGNTYKELIIPPNGKPFIPDGRNVVLPMQKGTRVIPAGKTRQFINNLPHFANGTEEDAGTKQDNKKGTGGIADGVSQAINDTLMPYIREIIRILQGNASSGGSAASKKTTTKYADTVKEIQKAWTGLAKWFETTVTEPITKGFNTMKEELAKVFDATNEELTQKYTEASTEWQGVLSGIPGWISENVGSEITNNFTDFCSGIKEGIETAWGGIQDVLTPVPGWIESNVTGLVKDKFAGIFSDIQTSHNTMWDIMSKYAAGKTDWITAIAEAAFTRFSYLINEFENKLGALERSLDLTEGEIRQAENMLNETSNKLSDVKKQIDDAQAAANDLNAASRPSNTGTLESVNKYVAKNIATIPDATQQFVQNNISRPVENVLKPLLENLKTASNVRVKRYAAGGFPEDGWFRASHGEIMGQFDNGQSVVANNYQITNGIADAVYPAVYNAMMAAISSSSSNGGDIVVQIDGENVFRAVRNKDQDFYKRTHKGAFEH